MSVFLQFQSRTDEQGESSCLIHKWNLFLTCCKLRLFFIGSPILCLLLLQHHHIPGSNPLISCTRSTLIGIQWAQSLLPASQAFTLMNPVVKHRVVGEGLRFSLLFCLDSVFCEMRQSGMSGQELHNNENCKPRHPQIYTQLKSWGIHLHRAQQHLQLWAEDAEPR